MPPLLYRYSFLYGGGGGGLLVGGGEGRGALWKGTCHSMEDSTVELRIYMHNYNRPRSTPKYRPPPLFYNNSGKELVDYRIVDVPIKLRGGQDGSPHPPSPHSLYYKPIPWSTSLVTTFNDFPSSKA